MPKRLHAEIKKTRVLIIDDHPLVRLGMRNLLNEEPDLEVCGEAGEMTEALCLVDSTEPEVVIADLSLNGAGGLEMIKQIKARKDSIKILVSSMYDESLFAERALRAGAMGYVMKGVATIELVRAIRQVLSGKIWLSERMSEKFLNQKFTRETKDQTLPWSSKLTDREMEVFEMIGQGVPAREIAKRLHLSVKTVEAHRENLKRKLNVENAAELMREATLWILEQK